VSVLAARPSGPAPALIGAALAAVAVIAVGARLRKPLTRLPETELKWGVGVFLTAFGLYFAGLGLSVEWPGGDAAILYLIALIGAASQVQAHWLAREPASA
jgi:Ca2+/H+ antiporter, TMEM165/GDT1 family